MLLTIQFPFADIRTFTSFSSKRLVKPSWPIPTPDSEFVRNFGSIRHRNLGGIQSWVGENEICEANRSVRMRFCPAIKQKRYTTYYAIEEYVPTRIAFRRLYFDGLAVGKFELGISTKSNKKVFLSKKIIKDLLNSFLQLPVEIKTPEGDSHLCLLGNSAKFIATLYNYSTLPSFLNCNKSDTDQVIHGSPLLFLSSRSNNYIPIPYKYVDLSQNKYDINFYSSIVPFNGSNLRLFLANNTSSNQKADKIRHLRVYIMRLHAEHECLRIVLKNILSGVLTIDPRSLESNLLQHYINESTKRIGILHKKFSYSFDEEINNFAQDAFNAINPGQKESLIEILERLDFRKNIFSKVEKYINKWESIAIFNNIKELNMGDVISNNSNSKIVTRGSNLSINSQQYHQQYEQIKSIIESLNEAIMSQTNDIIPDETKNLCADILKKMSKESKQKKASLATIQSLGSSLLSTLKSIEPIARLVQKAIESISNLAS